MDGRRYYEAYDDRYRQIHEQNLDWFIQMPSKILGEIIERYNIAEGSRILEIGCGEGRDAGTLLKNGYDLIATDISPAAVEYCQKKYPSYADRFRVLDCVRGRLGEKFDLINAVAVVHMLVLDEDRTGFYTFIRNHLEQTGVALICTMGDGQTEHRSDITTAFELQDRIHEQTGKKVRIAGTSYRAVSFDEFRKELQRNGLDIMEEGFTDMKPDYAQMMYAVVKRS